MLCPIGQSNEKLPLQALAKWREYVTIIRFAMIKNSFHEYLISKAFCAFVIILTNLKGKKKVTEKAKCNTSRKIDILQKKDMEKLCKITIDQDSR